MSRPMIAEQKVFSAAELTETVVLSSEFAVCPTKVVEIITAGFSGTIDIKGGVGSGQTKDNVAYSQMQQDGIPAVVNDQLSYSTETARKRYLITEPYPYIDIVMVRTVGSVTINVYGFGGVSNLPFDVGNPSDAAATGAVNTVKKLYGYIKQLVTAMLEVHEHIHSAQEVYPTLADGVTLTTAAGDWALGTIVEIVPADTITSIFDIHELVVEDVNTQDKTYEVVLYQGASDIEVGRVRFASTSNKGGVVANMQTERIAANSRIRAKAAIEDGSGKTCKVSIRYHTYDA